MKKVLNDWFTGPGSTHYDLMRFLFFVAFVLGIVLQGYAIYQGQEFDFNVFAQAVGTLLLTGGVATAAKDIGSGKASSYKDISFLYTKTPDNPQGELFDPGPPNYGQQWRGGPPRDSWGP